MLKKIFLTGLFLFGVWTADAFARGDSIAYIPVEKLDELAATPSSGNDFIPVYDASAKKDKKLDVDRIDFQEEGDFDVGTDVYELSAGNPYGSGTLTLDNFTTYIISDNTGAGEDVAVILDGSTAGQQKRVVLADDAETSGTAIAPDNPKFGPGGTSTSILLNEPGESVTLEWSGSVWSLVSNVGGVFQPDAAP